MQECIPRKQYYVNLVQTFLGCNEPVVKLPILCHLLLNNELKVFKVVDLWKLLPVNSDYNRPTEMKVHDTISFGIIVQPIASTEFSNKVTDTLQPIHKTCLNR